MTVSVLTDALDTMIGWGPDTYADAESMVELRRQHARLEALIAAATDRFDTAQQWALDGARSAATWIAWLPNPTARRQLALARHTRHLPAALTAWQAGDLTAHHVGVLGAARRPATADALARDEQILVDQAAHLRFEAFAHLVAYWDQRADPDGGNDNDEHRRTRRDAYLSESFDGMWLGKVTLDPISGAIVAGELRRLETVLFETDWAQAKTRLGRTPTIADLARTPAQRRADALVEMATRSRSTPPDAQRPRPLFTVLVGYETLHGPICELASGTVLAPGALVPWLDQTVIERAVFGPDNRVDVSHRARLFTGATRRAIELRDRHCTRLTCDISADRCQADHIIPYAAGGPTTQDNGRLLCDFHNQLRTKRGP